MKAGTICLLVAFSCLPAPSSLSATAAGRPNVLLITADDLGNQLSCYGELVSLIDILPTILAAAGVGVPPEVEGRSLLPLRGDASPPWREGTGDPLVDPARLERWRKVAAEWKKSAPRLPGGDYPDVALVPPGGLELLK